MKTKVVFTVDTEPSIAGAFIDPDRHTPLIDEPVWAEVNGQSEALGFLIRTLGLYHFTATFFVETVHTSYFSPDRMGYYVEKLLKADQDIQLHIHPAWRSFKEGKINDLQNLTSDASSEADVDFLTHIITEGCDLIEQWTAKRPTGLRTGNFSTAMNVFQAMEKAGLKNASNICQAIFPPPEKELNVTSGLHHFCGITELPVTCFKDHGPVGRGRLRPMQITALNASEHIALLNQIHDKKGGVAMIVTHPFEFIKKDDFRYNNMRANKMVQKRFEKICAYLAKHSDRFEVVTLEQAAASDPASCPEISLDGHPIRGTLRAIQNYTNDKF